MFEKIWIKVAAREMWGFDKSSKKMWKVALTIRGFQVLIPNVVGEGEGLTVPAVSALSILIFVTQNPLNAQFWFKERLYEVLNHFWIERKKK